MKIQNVPFNQAPLDPAPASENQKLKQACADFESILIDAMFQSMRKTLSGDDIFGKSLGRDIYESMYYTQLSKDLAENNNGLGVGEMLYQQLSRRMEKQPGPEHFSGSVSPVPLQKYGQSTDTNIDVE